MTNLISWKQKFEDEENFQLEGGTKGYIQSIDRDQAWDEDKQETVYDFYILTNIETDEQEEVSASVFANWAKTW